MSEIALRQQRPSPHLDVVDSARMLSFDDQRWNYLTGGYKSPFDPRPCLRKLENQQDTAAAWEELWDELHHQGDVGDASYAAVPELIRIHRIGSVADWNLYAMVSIIQLARTESQNPDVPDWLRDDYFRSSQELAHQGDFVCRGVGKQNERSSVSLRLRRAFGRTGSSSSRTPRTNCRK